MKEKEFKEFMPVTTLNRKNVITLGRILYYIHKDGKNYKYNGYITIDPCFTKGWWRYPFMPWERTAARTHWRVYWGPDDMNYDDWVRVHRIFIDKYIENNTLFFKSNDPILQFYKE